MKEIGLALLRLFYWPPAYNSDDYPPVIYDVGWRQGMFTGFVIVATAWAIREWLL